MKAESRIGQRFGRWTIIGVAGYVNGLNSISYLCRCDCGQERAVQCGNLFGGRSTQCQKCGVVSGGKKNRVRNEKTYSDVGVTVFRNAELKIVFSCSECGKPCHRQGGRCYGCGIIHKLDVPITHPISIGTLSRAHKISRQRVSQLIGKLGWDGMLARLEKRKIFLDAGIPVPATTRVRTAPTNFDRLKDDPKLMAMLGARPDGELADKLGVSTATICVYRRRLGLLRSPSKKRLAIETHKEMLGKVQDHVVAKAAGVSLFYVQTIRRQLRIPKCKLSLVETPGNP